MINRSSESLRAHEEGTGRCVNGVKGIGVLNLGNYDFPHRFGPFRLSFYFDSCIGYQSECGGDPKLNVSLSVFIVREVMIRAFQM